MSTTMAYVGRQISIRLSHDVPRHAVLQPIVADDRIRPTIMGFKESARRTFLRRCLGQSSISTCSRSTSAIAASRSSGSNTTHRCHRSRAGSNFMTMMASMNMSASTQATCSM